MFCTSCGTRLYQSIDGELICRQCFDTREALSEGDGIDYYEIGKKDGISQYQMDMLTEIDRDKRLLVYTAITSEHFEIALERTSLAEYVGGFVIGWLMTQS